MPFCAGADVADTEPVDVADIFHASALKRIQTKIPTVNLTRMILRITRKSADDDHAPHSQSPRSCQNVHLT